jgi:hypothetical protein
MSVGQRKAGADRELNAIAVILDSLQGLDGESIQRVLDYVFTRLSISRPAHLSVPQAVAIVPSPTSGRDASHVVRQPSIRDLKEEKKPESSNQMAAIVAYFLSEMVQEDERKEAVNAADLERYFKQAAFKLPKAISQALPNAAAAGYFEAVGNGLYRLNAVGYNLVVHGLPRVSGQTATKSKSVKKKNGR